MERNFGADYESLARGGEATPPEDFGRRLVEAKEARPPEGGEALRKEMSDGLSPGGPSDNTHGATPAELARLRGVDLDAKQVMQTSTDHRGKEHLLKADYLAQDGTTAEAGHVRMLFDAERGGGTWGHNDAILVEHTFEAKTPYVEDALMQEANEQARSMNAENLRVWIRNGDHQAEEKWGKLLFEPLKDSPNANGKFWIKPV